MAQNGNREHGTKVGTSSRMQRNSQVSDRDMDITEDQHSLSPSASQSQSSPERVQNTDSLGAAIAKGLGLEDQQVVERGITVLRSYLNTAQKFVSENPKEAAVFTAAVGVATWAALFTMPGKWMLRSGKSVIFPQLTKWISDNITNKNLH